MWEKGEVFHTSNVKIPASSKYARLNLKRTQRYNECWPDDIIRRRSQNTELYSEFALELSEILAQNAVGTTWGLALPTPGDHSMFSETPFDGVWASVELPALKGSSKVDKIVCISSLDIEGVYWKRPIQTGHSNWMNKALQNGYSTPYSVWNSNGRTTPAQASTIPLCMAHKHVVVDVQQLVHCSEPNMAQDS